MITKEKQTMKRALLIITLLVAAVSWTMTVEAQCFMHSSAQGAGPGGRSDFAGLNLSADQQKSIDTLHQGCWKVCAPLGNRIEQKQVELKGLLLEPKPDADKAKKLLKEISELQLQLNEKRLSCQLEARKILTPEQMSLLPPGCSFGFGNMLAGCGPGPGCGIMPGCGKGMGMGPGCGKGGPGRGPGGW
jgi:Spy/CpxP family protein refolding chaperone